MKNKETTIGKVQSIDTGTAVIKIDDDTLLNSLQVNQLVKISSSKTGEEIIGLISKIMRKAIYDPSDTTDDMEIITENIIKVNLIGTYYYKEGVKRNIFKRTLNSVPSIDAECFHLKGAALSEFMKVLSTNSKNPLTIGKYTISNDSDVNIDGNKFFQRHAVIVGGTGSGKSWTVAKILEKASELNSINCIVFDVHGEYKSLAGLKHSVLYRIAGPNEKSDSQDVIFLPYWLLSYEEMEAFLLDRSDSNAPNQARALFDLIIEHKRKHLESNNHTNNSFDDFTIDSPLPYNIEEVIEDLKDKDKERVTGERGTKQGPLYDKLTRFIQRLQSKRMDKRLNFIFNSDPALLNSEWFENLANKLFNFNNKKGLIIIDFSEVPSDILPLITGMIGRLVFSIQQWVDKDKRHPIALFCDEAHLYLPNKSNSGLEEKSLRAFERIAKEGRKYGVSLIVISQRPSDVNKTILSQCGNFVAMRLTNNDDQSVIKRLLPDSLGDFSELLPILDIGECLIVGDAALLPSRVIIEPPSIIPDSATIDFWDEWGKTKKNNGIKDAIVALINQHK